MARIRDGKFASLRTKLLWTALFFLCFMIGRYIPIPLLHGDATSSGTNPLLNAANVAPPAAMMIAARPVRKGIAVRLGRKAKVASSAALVMVGAMAERARIVAG